MRDVVICEPVRTPIGRYGGRLAGLSATELGAQCLLGLMKRTGLRGETIDDVILGHCYPSMAAPAIGRVVALDAGLPVSVPGLQVDRRCGSGLQSVLYASRQVAFGDSELVVAGGVESMSNAAHFSHEVRRGTGQSAAVLHDSLERGRVTAGGRLHPVSGGMLETAETLRREYSITRQEQDELAVRSHHSAIAAQDSGASATEIVAVTVSNGRDGDVTVDQDEHPRRDTSLEALARLRPLRLNEDPDATVTAGNASGQNDAAALCIVTTPEMADRLGLRPLIRIVSAAVAGVEPGRMGIGPVPATTAALERAGLRWEDLDLIELNEAFAAQALAVMREWQIGDQDLDRINVRGSGISLGHPVGATGTRMIGALARELALREQRFGLATMCVGGGQGLAVIVERVA
ncbi:acetyl-CoA C-acetyltransferase [Aeromicrobium panaciterrae]|uniref:acetyl-CoA C-acetyltransferase n=1 Tax=Aeromicrobium panaciterrae TaxID=363861 RepID=UPI0031D36BFE